MTFYFLIYNKLAAFFRLKFTDYSGDLNVLNMVELLCLIKSYLVALSSALLISLLTVSNREIQ